MQIVPFQPEHVVAMRERLQPMQQWHMRDCTPEWGEAIAKTCHAWAAIAEDGRVLGVAGALQMWEGRAHLWSFLAFDMGPHMLAATREIRRKLEELPFRRYEAEVSDGFDAAHRWVKLLGFKCETPDGMEAFFPDGDKGYMYSKVKA